ncbi:MAG: phage baseplate assembly protein V [Nibricoccus sp.]
MIGKVENNLDTENLGRVQLSFPHLSDVNLSAWARIATPMAGNNIGTYFLPDVGDEVLVSFEGGDINKPVVLGGLWNGMKRPPSANLGFNEKKMIKLKSGMQIVFDETPGTESLTIQDKMGSSIKMSSPTGDITIEAKGNVIIKSGAAGKIDLNP